MIKISDTEDGAKHEDSKKRLAGRWWNATAESVGSKLFDTAVAIERVTWPRRYLSLTCFRYMSGRPTSPMWNFALSQRPGNLYQYYSAGQWQPPAFNGIAQCADFLQARIFKNRPFTQVTPIAGDLKARLKSRHLSRWIDQQYHDLELWPLVELCGIDAMTFGTGLAKVHEGLDGKMAVTRVLPDELLVNEEEALYVTPPSLIQRVFAHREQLLDAYGDDPKAVEAIRSARSVFPGFYYGADLNTRDIVPYLEGWRLPYPDGSPGRHVLAIGTHAVLDEEWTRPRYPFAKLQYKQLSTGYFGQGLAEQLLGLQREVNRLFAAIWESNRRMAWPRVVVDVGSKVQDSSLADKAGGIVKGQFTGAKSPEFVFPPFASDQQFTWLLQLVKFMRERAGISDQSAAGQKPAGLSSGLAIEKWQMVEDTRHVDLSQRQEDFVTQLSELLVDLGEELRPDVIVPGNWAPKIKWSDIDLRRDSYFLRAFPMGSLPQTIGGKQQIIDTWWANGQITKQDKMRLEQTYDLAAHEDLATASDDFIESSIDDMLETGEFVPPSPFCDLTTAVATAQSRALLESLRETPQDKIDLLFQYAAQAQELMPQAEGPTANFGIQPPAGVPQVPPVVTTPPTGQVPLPPGPNGLPQ